jgi:hypothetical protein
MCRRAKAILTCCHEGPSADRQVTKDDAFDGRSIAGTYKYNQGEKAGRPPVAELPTRPRGLDRLDSDYHTESPKADEGLS